MPNETNKTEKRKRRSISALTYVKATRAELEVTGLTEENTVGDLLDAVKDKYFADNS